MKKRGVLKEFTLLLSVFILVFYAGFVFADDGTSVPQGPDYITISDSGRHHNASEPVQIQAKAGNVTALVISHTTVTEAWQGYYGNISGTITLDDADNFTMYDWALPDPSGEIYASNGTNVNWVDVYCMNLSHKKNNSGIGSDGDTPQDIYYNINMSQIELNFGINITDADGLNETFNDTYTDTTGFRVGAITIDVDDGCSLAHPYTDEGYDSTNAWDELLLSDNTSLIFTSLIRDDADGYQPGDGDTYDFEILVLENGHPGSEIDLTNYYFYVELA